jgi:hypothetical protein
MTGRQYGSKTPIDIGSRLELMVDDHLIARVSGGAALRLNRPIPREVVLVTDRPWEGNACSYFTVFQDGELYRMYYYGLQFVVTKTANVEPHPWVFCYAESNDGVRWIRPELGLVEFNGSRKNNIILDSQAGIPTFAPFKDANPNAAPDAQYKAWIVRLGLDRRGLYPLKSPDGIHWTAMSDGPVITHGLFDSHNLAFWDTVRGEYRDYHRSEFRIRKTGEEPYSAHRVKRADGGGLRGSRYGRDILTATSQDFIHWTEPRFIDYSEGRTDELYTNGVIPEWHLLKLIPLCNIRPSD